VIDLFRFIDWVLHLPKPQELAFWHDVREIEEEKRMRYITSIERIGMEQGLQQGQAELVLGKLTRRFGAVPPGLALRIRGLPGPKMLILLDVAYSAASLDEVAAALDALLTGAAPVAA
jgi:hypothetical protein